MEVMLCQRGDCTHISCDRHSDRYGYICNNCFEELVNSNLSIEQFLETNIEVSKEDNKLRRKQLEREFRRD